MKVWELIGIVCGCFAPSDTFLPYIQSYIKESTKNDTSIGLLALEAGSRLASTLEKDVARSLSPSIKEMESIQV